MDKKNKFSVLNDFPYDYGQMKINSNHVSIRANVISGKDKDDIWIFYCPSLNVTGYGDSKEEAKQSFEENITLFCEDILALPSKKIHQVILQMGWEQVKYKKKHYSKSFVNEESVSQGLEYPELLSLEIA